MEDKTRIKEVAETRLQQFIDEGVIISADAAKQEGFMLGWNEAFKLRKPRQTEIEMQRSEEHTSELQSR